MTTRILLADQAGARFYDLDDAEAPLRFVGEIENPAAHGHDRDLKSDRPGRVFDHAPDAGQRRGAVAHHATGGERTPKRHEAEVLANHIASELESGRVEHRFDRLVVIAGPRIMGTLRAAFSEPLRQTVAAEIVKDLMHESESALRAHIREFT